MLNNLLAIIPGTGDKANNWYFDNFGEALVYALIGFLVVFVGIVFIIFVIWLVGIIMTKFDNKNNNKKDKPIVVEKEPEISAVQQEISDEVSDEVKAAIVAAIMAYYQEKEEKCEFTVRRIKRI